LQSSNSVRVKHSHISWFAISVTDLVTLPVNARTPRTEAETGEVAGSVEVVAMTAMEDQFVTNVTSRATLLANVLKTKVMASEDAEEVVVVAVTATPFATDATESAISRANARKPTAVAEDVTKTDAVVVAAAAVEDVMMTADVAIVIMAVDQSATSVTGLVTSHVSVVKKRIAATSVTELVTLQETVTKRRIPAITATRLAT